MKIARIPHYVRRAQELGPRKTIEVITHRVQTSYFEQYARYQADQKKASHQWSSISGKTEKKDFNLFLESLTKRSFLVLSDLYKEELANDKELMRQANAFAHNCFDILGSREQCLISIPWHSDFRLRYQHPEADYLFDKRMFYKDIIIQSGLTDRLTKDIKVPWELARFQHLFVMGAAYNKGNDPLYARSFVQHVNDFLDENPFLLGPNWVCPMDVGIRAANWVWAFNFFKKSEDITPVFWERFVCSLYDHMHYLEHNWEVFGVTSNHYLSDLIGYFYVTWFFKDLNGVQKKHEWCYKELLKEFEKQVFEEGTDYEGSTNYHCLVTEIFYHFYMLSQESGFSFPKSALEKLQRMFSFIDWATVDGAGLVKIGDDDSGKILQYGITQSMVTAMKHERVTQDSFFKKFGLSAHKSENWHVTLRHHAYTKEQPSGHFHNDIGSITVAYKGIPVFVDPGSYVYTPSTVWRNAFRSVEVHNSFFIEDVEPVLFSDSSLFVLDIPEKKTVDTMWKVRHYLYSVGASRVVHIDEENDSILLEDSWDELPAQGCMSVWNFTLSPEIEPVVEDKQCKLLYKGKPLLVLVSEDIIFETVSGWFAPAYGSKIPCKRLVARCPLSAQPVRIKISKP